MCGIYGFFDRTGLNLSEQTLAAMDASLVHRGPDDSGAFTASGVTIGNRRLSIIDLAGGHQPFVSDDGRIALVQNGEIFNHVELRAEAQRQGVRFHSDHSDTEVLLRLYEREGLGFLPRLNGMFAIAIWDGRDPENPRLHLVRDRIGVKPLFVHDDGRQVLFGSEIKAVLAALPGRPALDLPALQHYLAYNYVPPPFTLFAGVRHVMPGTVLTVDGAGSHTRRWWSLAEQTPAPQTFSAWQEEFLDLLDDAVRLRLRADVPFGAFLSGGVDSSTVVALMARHVREPARTFCIGFPDPRFDESPYAREAAQRFGATHRERIVQPDMLDDWARALWHCDQPHGDASFMPTRSVSQLAVQDVKVVLTGDGGDELFAGYDKYASFMADPALRDLPAADFARHYVEHTGLFGAQARAALLQPWLRAKLADVDSERDVAAPWFEQASHFDRVNQMLFLDMMLLLPGNNLVKPDRMGMSVSLEARTPFLDWRLMEFAFRAPGDTKLKDGDKKHWFKRAVEPLIGADLAHRKKQMFTVPIGEWFRGPRKAWLAELLFAPNALGARLFEANTVRKLFDDHVSGAANHTRELRALAALELWAQQFEPELPA
ncbi:MULTISPECIES: asparagine synthase (glutamine-hydrolyzing) [unclassified Thiomonas]|jgi:asparagine synthase (glutamine-hydrolysing)|uniref:asparagine synthase (glutamine-hydrolyzing) n=1 Tax=unclassified Thiomonas TaxID=2625466 RepID=UPI0004DB9BB1|nr:MULTISPECIES: asparagine synthase (glutamine-hydrolyzing) [unclassified Thiomonas]CDW94102.1 Asparagine synthetase [Thiomonas sp. CB2]VDY04549.1 Asparagine synthetase [Thiomonas sp. Bio17B3]VDY08279.1 Asparagine synthetase [Thiomonas sp. Sup16B3]VDY12802.1 putative Asparagine synthase (glutamine-hydrolyzing) [Thiomonas sp. OC7]VDY17990.1 Asparagine synthetase [Thiomonas sp. CB2]